MQNIATNSLITEQRTIEISPSPTEIETLPAQWKSIKLGEIAKVLYGKARTNDSGTIPVIGSGGVYGYTVTPSVDYETIIIGRKGAAGSVYYSAGPCYPSDTTFYLAWKQDVCISFLYFSLVCKGLAPDRSVIPSLQRGDIENFHIILPPLPEQRAIAHVLQTAQNAIQARRKELELECERKATLMQHLFIHGTRGGPTKQTGIGQMPESWQVECLGNICTIATGTTPATNHSAYYDGNIPFVKTSEIVNNRIQQSETHISENAVKEYNLKLYAPGTIFLAMYGQGKTRGQVALLEIFATTTQNTGAIVPGKELNSEFLWQWLMSQYANLRDAGSQGHISHLNLGYVKQYQVPVPSLREQEDIKSILGACDSKITALEKK